MSETSPSFSEERRAVPRVRSLKKGVIAFQNGYCTTECMIRNKSEIGAMLLVSQNRAIPDIFKLKVHLESDFRPAEVVWRTPDAMGIRYVDAKFADPAPQSAQSTWDGVERRSLPGRRQSDRRN